MANEKKKIVKGKYKWSYDDSGKKKTGRPKKYDENTIKEIQEKKKLHKYLKKKVTENKDLLIQKLLEKWLDTTELDPEGKKRREIIKKLESNEDFSIFTDDIVTESLEEIIDPEQFLPSLGEPEGACKHIDIYNFIERHLIISNCQKCSRLKKWSLGEWKTYVQAKGLKAQEKY